MLISTLQKPYPFVTLISGYIQQGMLVPELWGYREPAFQSRGVQPRTSSVPASVLPSTGEEPMWFHWEGEENFGVEYPTKLWLSWTGDMRIALLSLSVALEEIVWPTAGSKHKHLFWSNLENSQPHMSLCQSHRSASLASKRFAP